MICDLIDIFDISDCVFVFVFCFVDLSLSQVKIQRIKVNSQLITQYISLIAIILFVILFCLIIIVFIASLIKSSCSNSSILGIQTLFITFFDIFIDFGYLTILCLHFNTIFDDYFLSFLVYSVSLLISIMINIVCSFGIFYKQFKSNRNKLSNE